MHRGEETDVPQEGADRSHQLSKRDDWGEKFDIRSVSQGVFSVPGKFRNKMSCLSER